MSFEQVLVILMQTFVKNPRNAQNLDRNSGPFCAKRETKFEHLLREKETQAHWHHQRKHGKAGGGRQTPSAGMVKLVGAVATPSSSDKEVPPPWRRTFDDLMLSFLP